MQKFQKLNEQELKRLMGGYSSKDCLKPAFPNCVTIITRKTAVTIDI